MIVAAVIVWGGVWIADHPSSSVSKSFLKVAELSQPQADAAVDEFLVFMTEDNTKNRRHLMSVSPTIQFVAESILPRVVVVRIPGELRPTLAAIEELEFVRMVFRYDPRIACH